MIGMTRQLVMAMLVCACVSSSKAQIGVADRTTEDFSSRGFANQSLSSELATPALSFSSSAQTFVTYECQHVSCAEVAKVLRPLIPDSQTDSSVQLVVDRELNRLLVAGPPFVQNTAKRLVSELDQPTATPKFVGPSDSAATQSMRAYKLPAQFHRAFVREIKSRFGQKVRISADATSENVFVATTQDVQTGIAELAANYENVQEQAAVRKQAAGRKKATLPRSANLAMQPDSASMTAAPAGAANSRAYIHFVRIPDGQLDRVQQQLLAVFGTRLEVATTQGRQIFVLRTNSKTPERLDIEFDRVRNGVLIGGSDRVASQLTVLIESLSRSRGYGQGTKVFGLRRDNHSRLRSVIESGSNIYRRSLHQQVRSPQLNGPTVRRLPSFQVDEQVQPAQFLAQAQPPTQQPPTQQPRAGADVGPVRQFEGVDVESLPDLDVIILRGPDQDLDQLAEVIEQLERISQEAQPEIRVFPLTHAQSEAVAEIVNEVSSDLVSGRQGKASVIPLVKPNAILIIGWGDAVVATEELIKQLDRPVAPETQSEVFRLKHGSASQVQQTLQNFFQNRGGLGPRVQLATDPATNSLIVYAAPRDIDEIRKLVQDIDQPEGDAVNRAQVFKIENALASDVAVTLQQAIQGAAGDGDRNAALELLDADGRRILRSGTLRNVQVTPNARNNTLIISSPQGNMELLAALIKQLDTPSGQAKIKVFRIVNGDAASLIQTLRSLIPSQAPGSNAVGSQLSATGEAGLAPLRFSVDARSNSIIATGAEGDLRIVEALLAKLDQTTTMQRKTAVYRLRNSPAIDIANAVNQYLLSRRQLNNAIPGQSNAFAEIEREVVVVPEPLANKLILAATPRYFEEIQDLIEKLDESPPQVMIQVLIAEVALDDADEFGVELGLQDSVLFDRSLLGDLLTTSVTENLSTADGIVSTTQDLVQAATNIPGFAFNSTNPLGNSGSSQSLDDANLIGRQAISNFSLGRSNEQLGFGGLVLSASSKNVSVLLRALRESRRVEVLSRPQIRTLDNQPAYIQVGQRVPRIVGSTINQFGGQSNSVTLEDVGLILGVTPRVSPDGTVVMEIDAEKSSIGSDTEGIPISVGVDGTVVRAPRVDTTTAQATVSAADGETIVLGGLITEDSEYVHRSVPILGDIPIVEKFFRYDSFIKKRAELLIILTPRVIRSPEDNERIRELEMARMSWCACDVYKLMDDIGYFPEQSFEHVEMGDPMVVYPDLNPTGELQSVLPPEPLGRVEPTPIMDERTYYEPRENDSYENSSRRETYEVPTPEPDNRIQIGGGR